VSSPYTSGTNYTDGAQIQAGLARMQMENEDRILAGLGVLPVPREVE
jgi:hypothetical protein